MEKKINMTTEKLNPADKPKELLLESSINYTLKISEEEFKFTNDPSIGADLAGLCITKRIHENMIADIMKVKENGLPKEFKNSFNNRLKDLRKSIHTIDISIRHLLKFVAQESVKKE